MKCGYLATENDRIRRDFGRIVERERGLVDCDLRQRLLADRCCRIEQSHEIQEQEQQRKLQEGEILLHFKRSPNPASRTQTLALDEDDEEGEGREWRG